MSDTNSRTRTPAWGLGAALFVLGICGGAFIATWAAGPRPPAARQRGDPPAGVADAPRATVTEEYFAQQVMPLVELGHSRDVAAIDTAKRRLDDVFAGYAERIEPFAMELNSFSFKYEVVKALLTNKLEGGGEMEQTTARLFQKDVVTDSQVDSDIAAVRAQFHKDLEADRKMVQTALGRGIELGAVSDPTAEAGVELLERECRRDLEKALTARAELTPMETVRALGMGVVAEEAIRKTVLDALAVYAGGSKQGADKPAQAGKAEEKPSKGAEVTAAAAGALAGTANYFLLQARYEAALTRECQAALDKMRDTLWSDPRNGLGADFAAEAELAERAHEMALRRAMLGTER